MNLKNIKNIIKESIEKLQLNENIVCSTEEFPCECIGGLPSQGSTTCTGTRTNYCNGGHTTDCMCCSDLGMTGGGGVSMIYKKR